MKVIELVHPLQTDVHFDESVIALGFFDGVHEGHKQVIRKAISIAAEMNVASAVMTFYPHPKEVLRNEKADYLTTVELKKEKIRNLGVDILYIVTFDAQFASLSPQQFVDQYLIALNVKHAVAGFDYTYGQKGKGSMDSFSFHSRGMIEATVIDKWMDGSEKISSSAIREALRAGDVKKAERYLGEAHQVNGKVVHGEKRGRTIGFPTANVEAPPGLLLPASGVYAVKVRYGNHWIDGVANIGVKPTFHENVNTQTLEVFLFQFDQDIYGKDISVFFYDRIRGEVKFSSVDELKAQISKDVEKAESILTSTGS